FAVNRSQERRAFPEESRQVPGPGATASGPYRSQGYEMTRIQIYDTSLRDGSQGEGVNFSLQDKLLISRKLDELGVDFIEGGYPLSNPKDAEFFHAMRNSPLKHAGLAAFGMTRRRGVQVDDDAGMKALLAADTPIVTIVGKTWDLHVHEVLRVGLD